jgi:hypothetical protein
MRKTKKRRVTRTKKIVFCLPGRSFSNNFISSWTSLIGWCMDNNIQPILANSYDSNVYYVRSKCLGGDVMKGEHQVPFDGRISYDYIMWIDSDMVFSIDNFKSLLSMNTDIASGMYKMNDGKHYATVKNWDKEYYKKNSAFEFLTDEHLEQLPDVFNVEYTGMGWMLIKKGVIENIKYPWFAPVWEEFGPGVNEFTSEDVAFCKRLQEKGYKIKVNKKVRIGHEKSWIL